MAKCYKVSGPKAIKGVEPGGCIEVGDSTRLSVASLVKSGHLQACSGGCCSAPESTQPAEEEVVEFDSAPGEVEEQKTESVVTDYVAPYPQPAMSLADIVEETGYHG